jgi:hypothetical protein
MQPLNYTHRIIPLVSLLALAACELPTKLGNLADSDSGTGTGTEATGTGDATDSTASETTAKDTDQTTTTGPIDPSMTSATTAGTSVTATTGVEPSSDTEAWGPCETLGEEDCELAHCMPLYGVAYDFPGCSEGQVFLGCSGPDGCDDAEATFCKDGTDEVYRRPDSCTPPGFSPCAEPALAFCGSCEALDEAACLTEPEECQPIYGAPHVELEGEMCVDYEALKFLLCISNGGACPPSVPTLCPIGSPEEAYDVPSGCVPPGFEQCEGAGTPQCP